MIKYIASVLFMTLVSVSVTAQEAQEHLISAGSFQKELLLQKGQLVDVRTPEEFNQGAIEGAVNIDFMETDFTQKTSSLDKQQPVFIYCKSGGRSAKAYEILKKQGFEKVYELDGGITAWNELDQE